MKQFTGAVGAAVFSTLALAACGASASTIIAKSGLSPASGSSATAAASASSVTNPFDIVVNFVGGLSGSQQSVFSSAEAFWETRITGNRYDLSLPALRIDAEGVAIDGEGGTLGQAGPQTAVRTNDRPQDYAYVDTGNMQFDIADIDALESEGSLFDVIVHEMAHVIGFGTLWDPGSISSFFAGTQSVYTDGTGTYLGAYAINAYNTEFGLSETSVPVELGFGPGTEDSHWDEADFVGSRLNSTYSCDIMTGFVNSGCAGQAESPFALSTISDTTIASFADIGFRTRVTDPITPIPLPSAALLLLGALGALGLTHRSRGCVAA